MAVAQRNRIRTPAGRDYGQDVLPRGIGKVGVWGLMPENRTSGLLSSVFLDGHCVGQERLEGGTLAAKRRATTAAVFLM